MAEGQGRQAGTGWRGRRGREGRHWTTKRSAQVGRRRQLGWCRERAYWTLANISHCNQASAAVIREDAQRRSGALAVAGKVGYGSRRVAADFHDNWQWASALAWCGRDEVAVDSAATSSKLKAA